MEDQRLALQASLDVLKTSTDRNKMGQYATPTALAREVVNYGLALIPQSKPIRFLDPAIGTGSFFSALLESGQGFESAQGFEIDPHYGAPALKLWSGSRLEMTVADFTEQRPPKADDQKPTLLICNPPYVRHHHVSKEEKERLHTLSKNSAGISLSGLSGLYVHFLAISHSWMADDGVAGWLVPSEFMDVNYGRKLKEYLLSEVTLLHIHRFDPKDVQFDDAIVSSAVVWFRKRKPLAHHTVEFSYGGSLQNPATVKQISAADLRKADKWTRFPKSDPVADHDGYRIADLFAIKRGLATGDNSFFILDEDRAKELLIPPQFLRPVLPSSRHIAGDEIQADSSGIPLLPKRLFLLDCDVPPEQVQREYPTLWAYLQTGVESVAQAYLCKSRKFWYAQEKRTAAPIVCTYMGRSDRSARPFRFFLNRSKAVATNVFLMLYPKPALSERLATHPESIHAIWESLNKIDAQTLLGNGRVYGGGLHKLEPKELANVPADNIAALVGLPPKQIPKQLELVQEIAAQGSSDPLAGPRMLRS